MPHVYLLSQCRFDKIFNDLWPAHFNRRISFHVHGCLILFVFISRIKNDGGMICDREMRNIPFVCLLFRDATMPRSLASSLTCISNFLRVRQKWCGNEIWKHLNRFDFFEIPK